MALEADRMRAPLEAFLAQASGAKSFSIRALERLSGGAVQENWRIDGEGDGKAEALVMRTSSASAGVSESLTRPQEFALLKAAFKAGIAVPEPLWLCEDEGVIGRPFHVMRFVPGIAAGHKLVKDASLQDTAAGDALAERLGAELARIHSIRPPRADLAFLRTPSSSPARHSIARMRAWLDRAAMARPALEWSLRWLERNERSGPALTLVHHDFRTGNYLVEKGKLAAILDWEFAEWGDPNEDIGWFCARCWRFGSTREAGGIGSRDAFYRGYEDGSGRQIDGAAIPYWEVMAHVRWAYVALQQGERHISGVDRSLELALTARIAPELELEALLTIAEIEKGRA